MKWIKLMFFLLFLMTSLCMVIGCSDSARLSQEINIDKEDGPDLEEKVNIDDTEVKEVTVDKNSNENINQKGLFQKNLNIIEENKRKIEHLMNNQFYIEETYVNTWREWTEKESYFESELIRYLDNEYTNMDFHSFSGFNTEDIEGIKVEALLYNANDNKLIETFEFIPSYIYLGENLYNKKIQEGYKQCYFIAEEVLNESKNIHYNLLVKYDGIPMQLCWFYVKNDEEIELVDDIVIADDIKEVAKNNPVPIVMEFTTSPNVADLNLLSKRVQQHYATGDYDEHRDRVNNQNEFYIYLLALKNDTPHEWKIRVASGVDEILKKDIVPEKNGDFEIIVSKVGLKYLADNQIIDLYNESYGYTQVGLSFDNNELYYTWVDITANGRPSE